MAREQDCVKSLLEAAEVQVGLEAHGARLQSVLRYVFPHPEAGLMVLPNSAQTVPEHC